MKNGKILISEFVSSLRTSEGLNVRDFGDKYGISRNTVSRYELGKDDDPSLLVATRFCNTFKINIEEFAGNFYYTDQKIITAFGGYTLLKDRASWFATSDPFKEITLNFYNENKNLLNLHNLSPGDNFRTFDKENVNSFNLFTNAYCETSKGERVAIIYYPYLLKNLKKRVIDSYSPILNDVYKVNCLDESRLKSRNFIFIVNNFEMYNFLKDIEFNNNHNNLIIALYKNDKELVDRYLLFGEDFTK